MPSSSPTGVPTEKPTSAPTENPTAAPTKMPTSSPTAVPTENPTLTPTMFPVTTESPTGTPVTPTTQDTDTPTNVPSGFPFKMEWPTSAPTMPTHWPTSPEVSFSKAPTLSPTNELGAAPLIETEPTFSPTAAPQVEEGVAEVTHMDLFFILDLSNSMNDPKLCGNCANLEGAGKKCAPCLVRSAEFAQLVAEQNAEYVRQVFYSLPAEEQAKRTLGFPNCPQTFDGWFHPECSESFGLRVGFVGFGCFNANTQGTAWAMKFTNKLVHTQEHLELAVSKAKKHVPTKKNGGSCPTVAIETVSEWVEEDWMRIHEAGDPNPWVYRQHKAAFFFNDGMFYNGKRKSDRPFDAAQKLRDRCVSTMALGISVRVGFQDRQRNELLRFVGNKEDRLFELTHPENPWSGLKTELVADVSKALLREMDTTRDSCKGFGKLRWQVDVWPHCDYLNAWEFCEMMPVPQRFCSFQGNRKKKKGQCVSNAGPGAYPTQNPTSEPPTLEPTRYPSTAEPTVSPIHPTSFPTQDLVVPPNFQTCATPCSRLRFGAQSTDTIVCQRMKNGECRKATKCPKKGFQLCAVPEPTNTPTQPPIYPTAFPTVSPTSEPTLAPQCPKACSKFHFGAKSLDSTVCMQTKTGKCRKASKCPKKGFLLCSTI